MPDITLRELSAALEISPEAVKKWDCGWVVSGRGSKSSTTADAIDVVKYLYSRIGDDTDELREAKIDLTRAQAKKEWLNVEILAGGLIQREQLEEMLTRVFSELRTKVLEIKSNAKTHIPKLDAGDLAILDRLCRDTLRALSTEIIPKPTSKNDSADD